jgi:catechol 2,3-dioxygenase
MDKLEVRINQMTSTTSSSKDLFTMPPATRLGYVHLTVADLERQLAFYTQVLGFKLHGREGSEAALGTEAEVLLRLTQVPTARRFQNSSGMYHFALLYPSRKELARAIARLFALRYPNSPTDHGVSMTTYLDDLEGNNIELYMRTLDRAVFETVDEQMVVRYADGRIGSGRDPLDLDELFSELNEGEQLGGTLPEGTRIGHMHLYVSSLEESMNFYRDVLGFEEGPLIANFRMGEVGLDEQQPHVIAFNTWKGNEIPTAPANALGIRCFTIVLPNADELRRAVAQVEAAGFTTEERAEGIWVFDPSHIGLVLTTQMLPTTAPPHAPPTERPAPKSSAPD